MKKLSIACLLLLFGFTTQNSFAQFGEPELRKREAPKNLYHEGYRTGFGFHFNISDFGVGVGGQFRRVINPGTEATLTLSVTGLRDPKEQTYIDYYFGFKTIPDKYKRVIGIPLKVGLKKRMFAEEISDNFRVFAGVGGGPMLAFSFPYFNDSNGNGFRENDGFLYGRVEQTYDIFTGWTGADTHFGWNGDISLGVDFGDDFGSLRSMQFGYSFNYFPDGIQIMQPNTAVIDQNFRPVFVDGVLQLRDQYDKRKFLGSVHLNFTFGWMWK